MEQKKKTKGAKIITVSNIKGGVAKTTTAATLAAGLNKMGYKVLMIDDDPQTNLTMCFMDEPEEGEITLYNLYKDGMSAKEIKREIKKGLDILPGDFNLCAADIEFIKDFDVYKKLTKGLKDAINEYDYIVIDTPPNLGVLTLNAFFVTDYIVTPMSADSFSLKAVRLLKKTLDTVSYETEDEIKIAGILLTKYNGRTKISKALERNVAASAELLKTEVFKSRIRTGTAVLESQLLQKDLFEYKPKEGVTEDYKAFVKELLEKMED